jgi:hypothetical protein
VNRLLIIGALTAVCATSVPEVRPQAGRPPPAMGSKELKHGFLGACFSSASGPAGRLATRPYPQADTAIRDYQQSSDQIVLEEIRQVMPHE